MVHSLNHDMALLQFPLLAPMVAIPKDAELLIANVKTAIQKLGKRHRRYLVTDFATGLKPEAAARFFGIAKKEVINDRSHTHTHIYHHS